MKTTTTAPITANAWGPTMKSKRYFWGTPHTETDVNAFEAAMRERAEDEAAGRFAAVHAVEKALERISRRSTGLMQFNALLAMVMLLLAYKLGAAAPALFMQFNRGGFALALLACVLLMPNLALLWAGNAADTVRQPHAAYTLAMGVHKVRAARYTFALVFSFAAAALTLVSLTQMG